MWGSLFDSPAGKLIGGMPAKVVRGAKNERARILPEMERIDPMELKQVQERFGRLIDRRQQRGILIESKRKISPIVNSAKAVLLQKYGFELTRAGFKDAEEELRVMTKLSGKIIETHEKSLVERKVGLMHGTAPYRELGFLISAMDGLRGRKFGDRLARAVIEQYETASKVGREVSPLLRLTFDSFRGSVTVQEVEKVLTSDTRRDTEEYVQQMLPVVAIGGIDLRKVKGAKMFPMAEFMNDFFQGRFESAAKSPVLSGVEGKVYGEALKIGLRTAEEIKSRGLNNSYYAPHMRGWMIWAMAEGIVRSGGKRIRLI